MDSMPCTVEALEERLSRPTPELVAMMSRLEGDIVFLGVGGKMGPTMAAMARRAIRESAVERRVWGVSRFTSPDARERLRSWGVETIACDLLDERAVQALPDAAHVVSMSGFKFGASDAAARTWAINCLIPTHVCRRYRASRIVTFSTGNVYGMTHVDTGGSRESDAPRPEGEYAMAALGRERMYEYFSQAQGTRTAILRLNYATEPRYGVLVDIAQTVLAGRPIDVSTAWFNVIWQGDANAMALRALACVDSPARVINVAGREILRVRDVATQFGELFGRPVEFVGEESPLALLNDGRRGHELLGEPRVAVQAMIRLTAEWLRHGGPTLGKPTMFQVRDGQF